MTTNKDALDALEIYRKSSFPDLDNQLRTLGALLAPYLETIRNALQSTERQSIGTAPKDETEILAFFPDDEGWLRVKFGYYGWELSPDGGTDFSYEICGEPTHWMPLPQPPKKEGEYYYFVPRKRKGKQQ